MTANPRLVEERNIDEATVEKINDIHEHLEYLIERNSEYGVYSQDIYDEIEELEFILQDCWKLPKDPNKHTWKLRYVYEVLRVRYGG